MDRRKRWRAAERLLKQGKVQDALQRLREISDDAPGGVVTLNRLADLLAQQGKRDEAIGYYAQIAQQFEQGGFVPKAIAIHKKILRLNPERVDSAISLGQLYERQNLHGEARKYLLHAAGQYLETQQPAKAREVLERLVAVEPDDLRHRVRLAETRAAEDDAEGAVADLVGIGERLLTRDEPGEAREIFERARELAPHSDGVLIGLARCGEAEGREDEALEILEGRLRDADAAPQVFGEVLRMYVAAGRSADALSLLGAAPVLAIPPGSWRRIFAAGLARGEAETLWEALDPGLLPAAERDDRQALVVLLASLCDLEDGGHLPALVRLARLQEDSGDVRDAVKALDDLVSAYRARSMEKEAAEVLQRMRAVAPPDEEPAAVVDPIASPALAIETTSLVSESGPVDEDVALDAEAPAVPLNATDEEFAAGRITQAEVLEKYDLLPQAVEQLEEVVARFPGHVVALERCVELRRALGDRSRLPRALSQLALARRAAGDGAGAKVAAAEAASLPELGSAFRRVLERLGLVASPGAGASGSTPTPTPTPKATPVAAPAPAPRPAPSGEAAPGPSKDGGRDVLIDLDDDDAEAGDAQPVAARAGRPVARVPGPDMLEAIRSELSDGRVGDARRQLDALVVLGYAGPELERLREEIAQAAGGLSAPPPPEAVAEEEAIASAGPEEPVRAPAETPSDPGLGTDEDLNAIQAALEEELAEVIDEPIAPEEGPDRPMQEMLQEFKDRIDDEVDVGDHRTHYELGIGFKEMGLLDEAIRELQKAAAAADLRREACAMIALCHREREEPREAAEWYGAALEGETAESEAARALRYDLAEVLLEAGEIEAALDHFRNVMALDPAFRDVQGRVSELESLAQS